MKSFKEFLFEMTREEALSILGLPASFDAEELKKAYRKASSLNHPDRGGSTEMMQKVNQANDLLSKSAGKAKEQSDFKADYEARNAKFNAAHDVVVNTIKTKFDQNAFLKYFEAQTGKTFKVNVETSKVGKYGSANHASLKAEFESDDKEVRFSMSVSVDLINVVYPKGQLSASENAYFQMFISTEFFANNRKQKITARDYNTQNELSALTDPKIVFPPAKVKKGVENKTSKFSKKDMLLALETKLDATGTGQDDWFIPIGNDRYLSIYRMVLMRKAAWGVRGVWSKKGMSFKREFDSGVYIVIPEDEAALGKFERVVAKLKTEKNPDNWATIINSTLK